MGIELAVALATIAARALVAELIRGTPPDGDGWATVASDMVGAFITSAARLESNMRSARQIDQLGGHLGRFGGGSP